MENIAIAQKFSLLSKLMTLHEENPFKIRSYSNAARQIERLPDELSSMTIEDISQVRGIGAAILQKIETMLSTGDFPLLEKYLENTPEGILNMLSIKGIGPKKLAVIWKKMAIETPGELLYACDEDRLTRFKGFGEKTQEKIRKAVEYYLQSLGYYLYAEALQFSNEYIEAQEQILGNKNIFHPTGELRRQCDTLSSLAYVSTLSLKEIKDHLPENFTVKNFDQETLVLEKENHPKIIITPATEETLGNVLFDTTGNSDFISSFYEKNKSLKTASFKDEKALFKATDTPFIHPVLRNASLTNLSNTKNLILPKDIKGIIHSHSKWSDGKNSIKEMALAAQNLGMEYLVMSDHSKSAGYANGLSVDRVLAQQEEIDELNQTLAPFKIFKSIESDIVANGSLDYDEDILKTFDLVIASIHSNLNMEKEQATNRLLTAISNPYTTILGHPTGRLLLSRKGYPIDHKAIIDACIKNKVVIEINAHPRRLDLDWQYISYAIQNGAILSIDPDAHSLKGLEDTKYGVWSAQKGGLTQDKNLSSFSLEAFEGFLKENRTS